jgi:O-antigen ligase
MGESKALEIKKTVAGKAIFFILCATIVWTTMFYGTVHQPIIAIFYVVMAFVAVLWAVDGFRSGSFRFHSSMIQLPLAATLAYGIVQIVPFGTMESVGGVTGIPRTISFDPFATQMAAFHFLVLLLFLASALTFVDTRGRLKTLTRLLAIFGFLYAFYAILQLVLSPTKIYGIYTSPFATPFGSFVNRHNFASYITMAMSVSLGLLFAKGIEKDKRLLYLTGLGVMGVALILSGSRGGLVSLIAGICFLAVITYDRGGSKQLIVRLAGILIIAAVVITGAVMIGGDNSLKRMAETASSDDVSTNRTEIWTVSTKIISENQPFGVGMGAFGVAYSKHDPSNGLQRVEQAHNDYLEVLADTGIVGAVIGVFFIGILFVTGIRASRVKDRFLRGVAVGALSGCFAVLVHSLFDFVLHTTAVSVLFLTLVAIIGASHRLGMQIKGKPDSERRRASVTPISKHPSV